MKIRKKWMIILILLLSGIVLGACGEKKESKAEEKSGTKNLSFVTAGSGGTFYPLGVGMGEVINQKGIANITVETSGGSVENTNLLGTDKADLGLLETGIAYYAANGTEMFKGNKLDNVRGIMTLYPNLMQMVVKADSGIETYADLKGKKVVVGQQGSSSMLNLQLVLEKYKLSFDDIKPQFTSFAEGIDMLKDGQVDAALVDVGVPAAAIIDISNQHDIRILSIDEKVIDSIKEEYPYFSDATVIPANTYKNQDKDVITAGVKVMLATRADLPEDLVYEMTKAIFEEKEQVAKTHSSGESINIETATEGMPIPLHPGAEKYINEALNK